MLITRGAGWLASPSALLRKRSAAAVSRLADRRKSIVAPLESTARYKYGCRSRQLANCRWSVGAAVAAKRFLAKALGQQNHPAPRVINTDGHAAYPPAIAQLKSEGTLDSGCQHRPVPYLNNVLEQDHRAIKRRVNASQGFRSFWAAWRTLAGYEIVHMIRKGQACWSAVGAKVGLLHRFIVGLFAATN